ncbi:MAG: zinc ABC transporter substrate-binding protein [Proteobacteria bacterium]|nr:zinc ABC transporter substrate-binding protein [Pseudomonadota bacterium]
MKKFLVATYLFLSLISVALAEVPRVSVDILPVHSLVSQVLKGLAVPDLLVETGSSPHNYYMRPSEAAALEAADIVFWVSDGLTPWFGNVVGTISKKAKVIELFKAKGVKKLPFREGAAFENHAHEENHEIGVEKSEDEYNPHAWLDPENGKLWLDVIATELSKLDPKNSNIYLQNAHEGKLIIEAVEKNILIMLNPYRSKSFVVFHDAYQYFEHRFDFLSSGAIALSDASKPSPSRLKEIKDLILELGVACVFAEPQYSRGLVNAVTEGTNAHIGVLNPMGVDLKSGPLFYPNLLEEIAKNISDCLKL